MIERDVDVERDGVEVEERRITPEGDDVEIEVEPPRLDVDRDE